MSRYALLACLSLAAMLVAFASPLSVSAYEPISGPELVRYSIRATKPQLYKLRTLALRDNLDLNAIAQQCFGVPNARHLTIAQAARLIHDLQKRGPSDISYPQNVINRSSATQDRVHKAIAWPAVWLFGL